MSFRFIRRVVEALRRAFVRRPARLTTRWVATDRLFTLRQRLEELEARTVPAAISWDDGTGTVNWVDANNWSGDVAPTAADDVTIGSSLWVH